MSDAGLLQFDPHSSAGGRAVLTIPTAGTAGAALTAIDVPSMNLLTGSRVETRDTWDVYELRRNSTEAPDGVRVFTAPLGGRFVLVETGSSGAGSLVPDLAALAAVPSSGLLGAEELKVQTLDQRFEYDPESTAAPDASPAAPLGITIVAPSDLAPGAPGRWLRILSPSPRWTAQKDWYVDPAGGDEEASGALGSPIATLQEYNRRMRLRSLAVAPYDVHLLSDVPDTDAYRPGGDVDPTGADAGVEFTVDHLLGTLTAIDGTAGTIDSADDGVVSPPAPPTLTDAGVDFSPHVGKLVRCASTGACAAILDAPALGTASTTVWFQLVTLGSFHDCNVIAPPAPGTAYEIFDRTSLGCELSSCFGDDPNGYNVAILDCEIPPGDEVALQSTYLFVRSWIRRQIQQLPAPLSFFTSVRTFSLFTGCNVEVDDGSPIVMVFEAFNAKSVLVRQSGFRNVSIESRTPGAFVTLVDAVFVNGRIFTNDPVEFAAFVRGGGGFAIDSLQATLGLGPAPYTGCGFFGTIPSGAAIRIKALGTLKTGTGVPYGVVDVLQNGVELREGATMTYVDLFGVGKLVPVFTGGTELLWEDATGAVPTALGVPTGPKVALDNFGTGAGGLTNGATFDGAAVDYRTLTRVFPIV